MNMSREFTDVEISNVQRFNIIYTIEGFCLASINLFLIISILSNKYTSGCKEYIIVCGKVFADGFYGFAYFIHGICGLISYSNGYYRFYYDRLYCLFHEFYNTLFIIAVPLTGLSITMVAIDRFIATLKPGRYYSLGKMYSWKMNICMISIAFVGVPICYFHAFTVRDILNVKNGCGVNNAVWPVFWPYLRSLRLAGTIFGILLYIPITINLFCNKSLPNSKYKQRLRAITATIGLTSIVEFFCFFVPEIFILFNTFPEYSEYCYFVMLSKGIINMFIYTFRHREVKYAVKSLIQRKPNVQIGISTAQRQSENKSTRMTSHARMYPILT
uniref:G-protein coupled receptors family 1 profile domain-containing protein n=1 Tax=Panagrolaimus superbus TaxID=310955 RepID=A0A914YXB6_9BILA